MSGFTEQHFMNDANFNAMKRTFDSHGYTLKPDAVNSNDIVGDLNAAKEKNGI